MEETEFWVVDGEARLRRALEEIGRAEERALREQGVFSLCLAGGSTPRRVLEALAREDHDWGRWRIWQADERCGEGGGSNAKMIQESLLGPAGIPPGSFEAIDWRRGAEGAARDYARRLNWGMAMGLLRKARGSAGEYWNIKAR